MNICENNWAHFHAVQASVCSRFFSEPWGSVNKFETYFEVILIPTLLLDIAISDAYTWYSSDVGVPASEEKQVEKDVTNS